MNNNETVKIYMTLQEFSSGSQSSCCGPIGQSEEQIEELSKSIQEEFGCNVEVIDVMMNQDAIKNCEQVVEVLSSYGPRALPVIALGDEVVSLGNLSSEMVVGAIREKANVA